ncbi:MAG: 1-acyl-sn-glycerol-3-phosphate acyltransferase [Bacilli bacterium]|nr:1-acyl-sn-glycerol-3-phosphate acyltransferase [Bacilli bacterium]MBO6194926.1 1-acyl-sn-glycerol-3-phosphate acyltransferase [Bacilli bacterium]
MKESKLYIILRPLIKIFTKLFLKPTYIGLDNIPKEGKIILAGNHTDIYDSILLISSTKRPIHFLAKKELWKFPSKIIMAHMGLIPVDRQNKSPNSLLMAKKYLNDDKLVLIFPEGTTEKEYGKLLPFKMGVIKLAYDTNTKIVPFAITGKYFKKDLRIKFGKPINVSEDLEKDLDKLKNNISNLRK